MGTLRNKPIEHPFFIFLSHPHNHFCLFSVLGHHSIHYTTWHCRKTITEVTKNQRHKCTFVAQFVLSFALKKAWKHSTEPHLHTSCKHRMLPTSSGASSKYIDPDIFRLPTRWSFKSRLTSFLSAYCCFFLRHKIRIGRIPLHILLRLTA